MNQNDEITVRPIGYLSCQQKYSYDVPRQGSLARDNIGFITILPEYSNALYRLDTFSHIWLVFLFHKNTSWKPMILPPRHTARKVGLFASRSPYRPSRIGISCVRLLSVKAPIITIGSHDLLEGTPILDIKPYLPYADSFPDASPGWTAEEPEVHFDIHYAELATRQIDWLSEKGFSCIRDFIQDRLSTEPLNKSRKRLCPDQNGHHTLAYRTWRILFDIQENRVAIIEIHSGYTPAELASVEDKYLDKAIHRDYLRAFQSSNP